MATGGTSRIPKGSEEQKLDVKRFAYDVLYITLSKCGFPETHLEVKLDDIKNNYSHPNYVISVHFAVIRIALNMRDQWKRMFEYKLKGSVLNDMQKVEKYLLNIQVLPEFQMISERDEIKRSLAFYSELILFLHYNNLEVDFGKLLDIWSNYFNKRIAVDYGSDYLLEAIFAENDDILIYLSFVDSFIEEVAKPYGKENYVSEKFEVNVERKIGGKSFEEARARMKKLTREFGDTHLESKPKSPIDPSSKAVEKSVSFSAIPERDSPLSGSALITRGQRIRPRIVCSPLYSPSIPEGMRIISKETPQERKDQESVLPDHRKYLEKPSEMAAEGTSRIQKYSIKRFAYDILYITLSKCGYPKTLLHVYLDDKRNDYCHDEYVLVVYSNVICHSLTMRDKWKRMFEYKKKGSVINDMQKVEKYLLNIEVLPEFSGDGELYKIWRSLAFYSELILFLHHNNLEVDFKKFLDIWSNYFNEKIAVKHESDVLLEGLFITSHCNIRSYVDFLDVFLKETAIPYGKVADISKRFGDFSEEVENFCEELINPTKGTPHNLLDPLPEDVAIVRKDSVSSDNPTAPEPPHNLPDLPPKDV